MNGVRRWSATGGTRPPAPRPPTPASVRRLAVAVLGSVSFGLALGACGSELPTVAHVHPIPTFAAEPTTTAPPAPQAAPLSETPMPTLTFQHTHASTVAAAEDLVRAHGYSPNPGQRYQPSGLSALIGVRTGMPLPTDQHVFFFYDGTFLGTDASDPSAAVTVAQTDSDTVTVTYLLFHPEDTSTGTAGSASVRFRWSSDQVRPLDPIPPSDTQADGSRR